LWKPGPYYKVEECLLWNCSLSDCLHLVTSSFIVSDFVLIGSFWNADRLCSFLRVRETCDTKQQAILCSSHNSAACYTSSQRHTLDIVLLNVIKQLVIKLFWLATHCICLDALQRNMESNLSHWRRQWDGLFYRCPLFPAILRISFTLMHIYCWYVARRYLFSYH
jgi:hypothetical protein